MACRGQCIEAEESVAPAHPIREVEHSAVRGAEHSDHPSIVTLFCSSAVTSACTYQKDFIYLLIH